MSVKCVHKGCGKLFDPIEPSSCTYHPGAPEFHEGTKGWKCCKPRVLSFDEFLDITPCTNGTHSAIEDTTAPETGASDSIAQTQTNPPTLSALSIKPTLASTAVTSSSTQTIQSTSASKPAPPAALAVPAAPEDDSDDPETPIAENRVCKRKGCSANSSSPTGGNECTYHPGVPIFHEGSKGYTCCKRRVLEFDAFLNLEGCKTRNGHCFVGKRDDGSKVNSTSTAASVVTGDITHVRHDFYQTGRSVVASLYIKQVDKSRSTIELVSSTAIAVDLLTLDHRRYTTTIPLFAAIDVDKSSYKILGTKVEFELVKADGTNWAVLRSDDVPTGEIIQTGSAARV